ncbi:Cytoplasmic GTPase/eEF2-like protein (ribosomal biogenesis) [Coelomomyces lativittatus]|nr:Cytoplasmic GTPase/eEF2-like protein (ribosomal biogenesis) [Coelomomyces lativittatus]
MPISLDKALKLQENSNQLRNICILAHVDHGKTSISDYLIATNGIISPKTCGSVRYLDSRPDEQERGITMEASAIALYFSLLQSDNTLQEYLINLIDCPGHVDFASEVNAASQLCDGALLVVDVVEGVCSQTHTALHQIWHERLQPILVLNKFDRLVDELKLTPLEAYLHLEKLIQNVNVITGEFYQKAMAEGDDHPEVLFSPLKGNVVFTSAIHGWGCQVDYFAHVFAAKLKLNVEQLLPWIWGEHYFDPKTKKILSPKQALGRHLKPLAVHLVFDNLWSIYQACGLGVLADPPHVLQLSKLESIVQKLSLKVNSRDYRKSSEHMVATVLAQWLPLSNALLIPIVKQVLPPHLAQRERLPKLFPHLSEFPTTLNSILQGETLQTSFLGYFAKMVALPLSLFPSLFDASTPHSPTSTKKEKKNFDIPTTNNAQNMENEIETELAVNKNEQEDLTPPFSSSSHSEDEFLVGIARCFCGQVRQGDTVYLLGPKFQADQPHGSSTLSVHVEALFLWLGQDIIPVPYVTAGQVFGIYSKDLQSCFFKCGTLSSTLHCPLLTQFTNQVSMVKVAVEPTRIQDLEKLVHGLRLLSQSDPAVEIMITASGEHVLATAGEVHLEVDVFRIKCFHFFFFFFDH